MANWFQISISLELVFHSCVLQHVEEDQFTPKDRGLQRKEEWALLSSERNKNEIYEAIIQLCLTGPARWGRINSHHPNSSTTAKWIWTKAPQQTSTSPWMIPKHKHIPTQKTKSSLAHESSRPETRSPAPWTTTISRHYCKVSKRKMETSWVWTINRLQTRRRILDQSRRELFSTMPRSDIKRKAGITKAGRTPESTDMPHRRRTLHADWGC